MPNTSIAQETDAKVGAAAGCVVDKFRLCPMGGNGKECAGDVADDARAGRIWTVIFGLTVQRVGKRFEYRCPECTILTGRLGLVREERPRLKLYCKQHPDICGVWPSEEAMEEEKVELAKRIGLG